MSKIIKYINGNLIEYEIFKLVDFYDPILRRPTDPFIFNGVDSYKEAEELAYSLVKTMGKYGGLGLSANQCGINKRVCTINMGKEAWSMFNPEIVYRSDTIANFSEGCLSYPGLYLKLNRADHIKVRFQAIGGQFVEQQFDGLTAVCVQHELDHLDGIVYTDCISPINLEKAKRKVKTNLKKLNKIKVA
jgi:peptide deformylase